MPYVLYRIPVRQRSEVYRYIPEIFICIYTEIMRLAVVVHFAALVSQCTALRLPNFLRPRAQREENGVDAAYPWRFDGRLWFRPALVRMPEEPLPGNVAAVGLFGWTVGGVVCLEYDVSPVGPYREYVTMGSLVTKRGALGQWGSRLFVSTRQAEEVCQRVWAVPAEVRDITFEEAGDALRVTSAPALSAAAEGAAPGAISVEGWLGTRSAVDRSPRRGGLPVLWTPSIKALWAPLLPLPPTGGSESALPLHDLRLSASSLRLHLCAQEASQELGTPLPLGLSVDGLRIEISRARGGETL